MAGNIKEARYSICSLEDNKKMGEDDSINKQISQIERLVNAGRNLRLSIIVKQ